jgi:hypothetical protein
MPFDVINTGTTANDGTGDPLRTAFTKVNDNTAKAVEGPASATADAVALYDGTTGKLLKEITKANLAADAAFSNAYAPLQLSAGAVPTAVTARYVAPLGTATAAQESYAAGNFYTMPFAIKRPGTIDRIGLRNLTAHAGVTVEVGIYEADATSFYPTNLLLNAGTFDLSSAAMHEITVSFPLAADTLIFLGCLILGGTATLFAMRPSVITFPSGSTDTAVGRLSLGRAGLASLPNPSGISSSPYASHPIIIARVTV